MALSWRECSVVITGSTCGICHKDFKCQSDVIVHKRWRHSNIIESTYCKSDSPKNKRIINEKCDVCDEQNNNNSDLEIYKPQACKRRRRARKLRLVIKIGGVVMTEIKLNRKYLKIQDNEHFVDVDGQMDLLKNNVPQDQCSANIDLPLPGNVVGDNCIESIQPHKATNRYIVSKFASNRNNKIIHHSTRSRRLFRISNTPNKNIIFTVDDLHENYCDKANFQPDISDCMSNTLTISDTDNTNIYNKENSQRINVQEKKLEDSTKDILSLKNKIVRYSDKMLLYDSKSPLIKWQDKLNEASVNKQQTFPFNKKHHNSTDQSSIEEVKYGSIGSKEKVEIIIDDNDDSNISTISVNSLREKVKETYSHANDDDVQEVLRITRNDLTDDINHESPNRSEREILAQNIFREMYVSHTREKNAHSEKNDVIKTKNNNIYGSEVKNNKLDTSAIGQLCYQIFDKKLNMYFEDLSRYKAKYRENLTEINNNMSSSM